MARPLRENRDAVADVTLTIRITPPERAALDALVAKRAAQLGDLGGSVSAASVVRALVRQAAQAEGLLNAAQVQQPAVAVQLVQPADAAPVKLVQPVEKPKAKQAPIDGDSLRARFLAAREAGRVTGADVALALHLAGGAVVSRWANGQGLPAKHWPTVDSLLRKTGF